MTLSVTTPSSLRRRLRNSAPLLRKQFCAKFSLIVSLEVYSSAYFWFCVAGVLPTKNKGTFFRDTDLSTSDTEE